MDIYELREMNPFDFEEYVAELFRQKGYKAYVTSSTGDYGVDVIAENEEGKIAIQCKRYASHNLVGVEDIYPVYTGKDFYDCDKAMIITTSDYTNNAKVLINNLNIDSWNHKNFSNENEIDFDIIKTKGLVKMFGLYVTPTQRAGLIFWFIITFLSFLLY